MLDFEHQVICKGVVTPSIPTETATEVVGYVSDEHQYNNCYDSLSLSQQRIIQQRAAVPEVTARTSIPQSFESIPINISRRLLDKESPLRYQQVTTLSKDAEHQQIRQYHVQQQHCADAYQNRAAHI